MFLVTFYMPRMWYNRRGLHLSQGGHKGRPQPPHPPQQNVFFSPLILLQSSAAKVKVNLCTLQTVCWGKKASISLNWVQLIFILQYVCGLKSEAAGGFRPWRPCRLQIQEDQSLNLLTVPLFSSQTKLYFESGCILVVSSAGFVSHFRTDILNKVSQNINTLLARFLK